MSLLGLKFTFETKRWVMTEIETIVMPENLNSEHNTIEDSAIKPKMKN